MKRARLGYVGVCLLVLWARFAHAAPGDLDPSFGTGGFAFTESFISLEQRVFSASALASGMAIQGDGKVVVAGPVGQLHLISCSRSMVLARFNADGTPDAGFGTNGRVLRSFGTSDIVGSAVALQPDGKIVVVAGVTPGEDCGPLFDVPPPPGFPLSETLSTSTSDSDVTLVVARYTAAGAPDTTFGVGGEVRRSIGTDGTVAAVAIQSDGRILVAGSAVRPTTGRDFVLVRLHGDGVLDTSFGATAFPVNLTGSVATDFSGGDAATALAIQGDGKILAVGMSEVLGDGRFALARYHPDGVPDRTFGSSSTGKVVTNFVANDGGGVHGDAALGVAIQGDGKIVVIGQAHEAARRADVALARYNPNGTLDTTFGFAGRVTTPFGDDEAAFAVIVQPDGRIVVAGFTGAFDASKRPGTSTHIILARYSGNGTLDTTFGSGGKVTTDTRGHVAFAMAIQSFLLEGRIVVAGRGTPTGTGERRLTLARFQGFTRTLTRIGSFDLGPSDVTVAVHQPLRYAFTWTIPAPQNWHDLHSLHLRIRDGADMILWVRFDEASNTFSVFNEAAGRFGHGFGPGSRMRLQTRAAMLDLAQTSVVGTGPDGPSVTLNLALQFKPLVAGRAFTVEVAASDNEGTEEFTEAGWLSITR